MLGCGAPTHALSPTLPQISPILSTPFPIPPTPQRMHLSPHFPTSPRVILYTLTPQHTFPQLSPDFLPHISPHTFPTSPFTPPTPNILSFTYPHPSQHFSPPSQSIANLSCDEVSVANLPCDEVSVANLPCGEVSMANLPCDEVSVANLPRGKISATKFLATFSATPLRLALGNKETTYFSCTCADRLNKVG